MAEDKFKVTTSSYTSDSTTSTSDSAFADDRPEDPVDCWEKRFNRERLRWE